MATKVTYISTSLPSDEQNAAFDAAVAEVRSQVGSHPLVIGGARRAGAATFTVQNPADRDETLGTFADASANDVADAVAAARAAFPAWSATPTQERARILQRAADLIRERVMFLGAVVALEVGKNRVESVGEVEETRRPHLLLRRPSRRAPRLTHRPGVADRRGPQHQRAAAVRRVRASSRRSTSRSRCPAGPVGRRWWPATRWCSSRPTTTPWSGVHAGRAAARGGRAGRRRSTSSPAAAATRARRWSAAAASTASPSPARTRWAARSPQRSRPAAYPRPCITEMGGKNPAIVTATADLDKAGERRPALGVRRASGQKCSRLLAGLRRRRRRRRARRPPRRRRRASTVGDPRRRDCRLGPGRQRGGLRRLRARGRATRRGATAVLAAGAEVRATARWRAASSSRRRSWRTCRPATACCATSCSCRSSWSQGVADLDEAMRPGERPAARPDRRPVLARTRTRSQRFLDAHRGRRRLRQPRAPGATTGAWPGYQPFGGWKG